MTTHPAGAVASASPDGGHAETRKPRVGFLGVGWIGRDRLQAIAQRGAVEVAAIADPVADNLKRALEVASKADALGDLDALLSANLDGIVIATPSALHAEQAIAALERGVAVFCQKPLARTASETRAVVDAAKKADRLLGVDLSYRHITGMSAIRDIAASGELGNLFAADLVFHNAYGPDKPWFYDPRLSGGGCVIDLGIHLVDLALWMLAPVGQGSVVEVTSYLYSGGRLLQPSDVEDKVEDYAVATLRLEGGCTVRLACSWKVQAGRDAVIEATFYGTSGGAALRNVDGSFYDFVIERYKGTQRQMLSQPPDAWGGRAAVEWAERLAAGVGYDPQIESIVEVAGALDLIYGRK